MDIREQIEWLKKEAQRHSQSASSDAFTSRRRSTFRHRAKKLRQTADTMEKLLAAVVELWTVADTSDLDAETALFVGGCVAEEMVRDQTRRAVGEDDGD